MRYCVLLVTFIARMFCSFSGAESHKAVVLGKYSGCVLLPLIFCGDDAIVLPTTRFGDVKGRDSEACVMEFVRNIGDTVLSFTASNVCCSSRELSEMFSGG
ncbi:hypothetical protein EHEL_050020 [Encephalitozoon hellem ATCC 50504]|uniref:Secreted protein n=1 Tax=Encephalitozoon hellem TaxID=27973 RepID=A0A9Q9C2H1_ENCHE|nr:uncharacterized protein EHEL_050020 [Encephalitozoon hellem ATCC 50504]AFM98213.1 hypothetical protein EHEL_050020 [Encephalitozoon hellem ATCC 50504]UTX42884.1 hypothetical protein GPU96_04g06120 [Encephalitozoon hellem]UTX43087.1 hypothetical protein GPU96_05g08260 [Encephalitozoon hellem]UTX43284.1 hypothetical protein GPU96_06g10300 [Encephalitozoon hellem]|eukprot:XP_003887194.1 hypothetical protein EHEL_050020 [Encephalitozoon hellem ATCC 50504]